MSNWKRKAWLQTNKCAVLSTKTMTKIFCFELIYFWQSSFKTFHDQRPYISKNNKPNQSIFILLLFFNLFGDIWFCTSIDEEFQYCAFLYLYTFQNQYYLLLKKKHSSARILLSPKTEVESRLSKAADWSLSTFSNHFRAKYFIICLFLFSLGLSPICNPYLVFPKS